MRPEPEIAPHFAPWNLLQSVEVMAEPTPTPVFSLWKIAKLKRREMQLSPRFMTSPVNLWNNEQHGYLIFWRTLSMIYTSFEGADFG